MNLAELQTEVILLTNRPDLTALTLSAVQQATLKCHQADFWYKDIYETGISFSSALYEQDFEVRSFIPLFRAIKYARVYDNADSTPMQFFTIIDPANVLDTYNVARTDVCYMGGAEIHFKCSIEFQHMLFGCYINPTVTELGYSSWIALDHPWAIIHEACRRIFNAIGQDKKAKSSEQEFGEQLQLIRINQIQVQGN
jgi:hypothetical protein